MKTQTVRFLSFLREYMKVLIPVTTIILALTSPSLTLADSNPQAAYVRVWFPSGTQGYIIATERCANGGCSIPVIPVGQVNDLNWQGQVGYMLVIAAYSDTNCSDSSFLGYGSDYVKAAGDCWFDIPNGSVSGACTEKTDPNAGQSSSSVS
jgi:hypothetical protein